MNNKQSFAQGKEAHTDSFPSLCFLTLDLQATSESPTEFIANFWGDPLYGLDLKKGAAGWAWSKYTCYNRATNTTEIGEVLCLRWSVDEPWFMLLAGGSWHASVAYTTLYLKDYYPPVAAITHLYVPKVAMLTEVCPHSYFLFISSLCALSRLRKAPEL